MHPTVFKPWEVSANACFDLELEGAANTYAFTSSYPWLTGKSFGSEAKLRDSHHYAIILNG